MSRERSRGDSDDPLAAYRRREFPVSREWVYLNHAGVAPTCARFLEAAKERLEEFAGHGVARAGADFAALRERSAICRQRFAGLVGCAAAEVAIVRNTSHGLALVARGLPWKAGQRIAVATEEEYPSNVHPWRYLSRQLGIDIPVDVIPTSDRAVTAEGVERVLRPESRLVAVSSAQFGSGAVTNLEKLGRLCARENLLLCVDGIQTVGALPIHVRDLGIHFLAADSHKWMLGTMGIGALYVDQRLIPRMDPVLVGWKTMLDAWEFDASRDRPLGDARRFEEGSPAYALIDGFSAALELLQEVGIEAIRDRIVGLVERAAAGLEALGCDVGPPPVHRRHILCFRPPGMEPRILVDRLHGRKIVVAERKGLVRVSPHFYNTEREIEKLIEAVRRIVGAGEAGAARP